MWMHKRSDDTADDCKSKIQDKHQSRPEALKLINFLSENLIVCNECRPAMFVNYMPVIHIYKETGVMTSDQGNVVYKLGNVN